MTSSWWMLRKLRRWTAVNRSSEKKMDEEEIVVAMESES